VHAPVQMNKRRLYPTHASRSLNTRVVRVAPVFLRYAGMVLN
jgi:hypothetical protein